MQPAQNDFAAFRLGLTASPKVVPVSATSVRAECGRCADEQRRAAVLWCFSLACARRKAEPIARPVSYDCTSRNLSRIGAAAERGRYVCAGVDAISALAAQIYSTNSGIAK